MGTTPFGTALVTGATGFVGASLIGELLARGVRVRAYARPSWKGRPLHFPPSPAARCLLPPSKPSTATSATPAPSP